MKNIKNFSFIILAFLLSLTFVDVNRANGWVQDGDKWKYEENGDFVKNDWRELDNSIYYFDTEGHMATELVKIKNYYHMFQEDGRPYLRNMDFWFKNRSYNVMSRGRIEGLENDMNDTDYIKFIVELRAKRKEDAQKKLNEAAMNAGLADMVDMSAYQKDPSEMTEQEKRLAAAAEYNRKQKEAEEAAAIAAKYARFSVENRQKLLESTNQGNDENSAVASMMDELNAQLKAKKDTYLANIKQILANDPASLNVEAIINDYNDVLKEYKEEIDTDVQAIRTRLGLSYTRYVLMKQKFTDVMDNELNSLRNQILGLI